MHSVSFGDGVSKAVRGQSSYFYIFLRDKYYNAISASNITDSASNLKFVLNSYGIESTLYPYISFVSNLELASISTFANYKTLSFYVFKVEYTVPILQYYTLTVTYENSTILNSPSVTTIESVEVFFSSFMLLILGTFIC